MDLFQYFRCIDSLAQRIAAARRVMTIAASWHESRSKDVRTLAGRRRYEADASDREVGDSDREVVSSDRGVIDSDREVIDTGCQVEITGTDRNVPNTNGDVRRTDGNAPKLKWVRANTRWTRQTRPGTPKTWCKSNRRARRIRREVSLCVLRVLCSCFAT